MNVSRTGLLIACCIALLTVILPSALAAGQDDDLDIVWSKTLNFDTSLQNPSWYPASFDISDDGSIFVTGYARDLGNYGNSDHVAFAVKADEGGNVLWGHTWNSSEGLSMKATGDGGCIVARRPTPDEYGTVDRLAIDKLDARGNLVWGATVPATGTYEWKKIAFGAMAVADDGGCVVAVNNLRGEREVQLVATEGFSSYQSLVSPYATPFNDIRVIRLDAGGNKVWESTVTGKFDQTASDVVTVPDGYLITGQTTSFASATGDSDRDFEKTYELNYRGEHARIYYSLVNGTIDPLYNTVLSFEMRDYDAYLVKVDADGNVVWRKTFGSTGTDLGVSAIPVDGGFLVLGSGYDGRLSEVCEDITNYEERGERSQLIDVRLLKVDADGNPLWEKTYYINNSSDEWFRGVSISPVDGAYVLFSHGSLRANPGYQVQYYEQTVSGSGELLSSTNRTYDQSFRQIDMTPAGEYIVLTSDYRGPVLTKYGQVSPNVATGSPVFPLACLAAFVVAVIVVVACAAGFIFLRKKK